MCLFCQPPLTGIWRWLMLRLHLNSPGRTQCRAAGCPRRSHVSSSISLHSTNEALSYVKPVLHRRTLMSFFTDWVMEILTFQYSRVKIIVSFEDLVEIFFDIYIRRSARWHCEKILSRYEWFFRKNYFIFKRSCEEFCWRFIEDFYENFSKFLFLFLGIMERSFENLQVSLLRFL